MWCASSVTAGQAVVTADHDGQDSYAKSSGYIINVSGSVAGDTDLIMMVCLDTSGVVH